MIEREEIKRKWGNVESESLSIYSLSLAFLILSPFPLHFLILSPFSPSPAATSCATLWPHRAELDLQENFFFQFLDFIFCMFLFFGATTVGDAFFVDVCTLHSPPWSFSEKERHFLLLISSTSQLCSLLL